MVLRKSGFLGVATLLGLLAAFILVSPSIPVVRALTVIDTQCHNQGSGASINCTLPTIQSNDVVEVSFEQWAGGAGCPSFTSAMASDSDSALTWHLGPHSCTNNADPSKGLGAIIWYATYSGANLTNDVITVNPSNGVNPYWIQASSITGTTGMSPSMSADSTNPAACTSSCGTVSDSVNSFALNPDITLTASIGVNDNSGPALTWNQPAGFSTPLCSPGDPSNQRYIGCSSYKTPTSGSSTLHNNYTQSYTTSYFYAQVVAISFGPTDVTQPLKFSPVTGTTQQTITLTNCSPSPSSFTGDTSFHNITASPTCSLTASLPAGYDFTGTGTASESVTTCGSGLCTKFNDTYYSTSTTVKITFKSSPLNLPSGFSVAGTYYSTTVTLSLTPGSKVNITAAKGVTLIPDIYNFSSWSDSGARSHKITVPSTSTTYIAYFKVTSKGCGSSNPLIQLENACIIPAIIDAWTAPIGPGPWFSFVLLGVNVAVYNKTQSVWIGMVILLVTGGVFSLFLPPYIGQISNIFLALGAAGLVVKAVLLLR